MNKELIPGPRCFKEAEERITRVYQRLPSTGQQNTVLLHLIKHLWKWMADIMADELRETGLNPVSFVTLLMLYSAPEDSVNPSELSQCTGETRTNMTRICNELEQQQLICRTPSATDRRRIDLMLTPAGIQQMETLLPKLRHRTAPMFGVLSDAEKDVLEGLLKKLLCAFEQQA
jgi:MarR family transcriptional repressor of emrRAB